jgi:DNA adenine methylase
VKHNFNGFIKYNQVMFSWDDQIRLRDSLVRARERGCSIVVSNADHKSIRDLYADFELEALPRASVIAGSSKARGLTTELLLVHHG